MPRADGGFQDLARRVLRRPGELRGQRRAVAGGGVRARPGETLPGEDYSLRWIYLDLIEEYARHNGHADLLREQIDGATGE